MQKQRMYYSAPQNPILDDFIHYISNLLDQRVFNLDNVISNEYDCRTGQGEYVTLNGNHFCVHVDMTDTQFIIIWSNGDKFFISVAPYYVLVFMLMGRLNKIDQNDPEVINLIESCNNNPFGHTSIFYQFLTEIKHVN